MQQHPSLGSIKSQISSLAVRLAALTLPNQGIGEVDVKRDMACAGGQLHGIPRMVKFLSPVLSVSQGKAGPWSQQAGAYV